MYSRNYLSLYEVADKNQAQKDILYSYQEKLLFLSKKDEGASFFMNHLAKNICQNKKAPVIHLKLDRPLKNEYDFLRKVGVHSF